jgi:HIV Tat-specific factor 1
MDSESDPRIAFSQVTGKWIFEDDETGLEYEYDDELGQWNPVPDKEEMEQQQKAYEKRKPESDGNRDRKKTKTEQPKAPKPTSAVYVSELPVDITFGELEQTFSRFGVIAEDLKTGEKKIRLYKDEEGRPKGDALVIYFKPESVPLAVELMDDTKIRPTDDRNIKVQKADYSYKKSHNGNEPSQNGSEQEGGEKRKQLTAAEKRKIQKLNNKLADWDDDDYGKDTPKKNPRVVVLKHVFTLKELEEDVTAALEIKEDIREGCEDIGPVTNVVLYDQEPEGIVTVKFKSEEDALQCVRRMDGRYFGGQALEAHLLEIGVKYAKSKSTNDDDEEEEKRLDEFGKWLEKNQ